MHEYALAEAVVRAVARTAREERLTAVTQVQVLVGELQQIHRETFEFALAQVRADDDILLAGARFEVAIEPARLCCRACGRAFTLAESGERDETAAEAIHFVPELAHAFLRCPACGSPDFDVTEGRGVLLGRIEGERGDG